MSQQITGTDILAVAKTIAASAVVKVTQVEQVIEFNQSVLKIDPRLLAMLKPNEFDISVRCLREEINEFIEAQSKGVFIGCVDAMVDLRYFGTGILYKMGLTASQIHKAKSMSSLSNWPIEKKRVDMLNQGCFDACLKHLHDCVDAFVLAYGDNVLQRCIGSIVDIGFVATHTMNFMGLSDEAIADCDTIVHSANILKKLGTNAKRAVDGAADAVKPTGWIDPSIAIGEIIDREIAKVQEV